MYQADNNNKVKKGMDYARGEPMPQSYWTDGWPALKLYLRVKNNPTLHHMYETIMIQSEDMSFEPLPFINIQEPLHLYEFIQRNISQRECFEEYVRSQVIHFLAGHSSTVMSYGPINCGKTYTLYGANQMPGIIPRSVDLIFSAVDCIPLPLYKPVQKTAVMVLNEPKCALETNRKERLLRWVEDRKTLSRVARQWLDASDEMNGVKCSNELTYSFWMSFAEIYNETIHDLLLVDGQDERIPLEIVVDTDGKPYVRGLRSVYATTAHEACQLILAGKSRMHVREAKSNSDSSRSHTVLTFTLLRYDQRNCPQEVDVSTLTFCDTAGTDQPQSVYHPAEIKSEIESIRNSHEVLSKCLKTVVAPLFSREELATTDGPFRESKLTRLFERELLGHEKITFIINVASKYHTREEMDAAQINVALLWLLYIKSPMLVKRSSVLPPNLFTIPNVSKASESITPPSLAQSPLEDSPINTDLSELKAQNERLTIQLETLKNDISIRENAIHKNVHDYYSTAIKKLIDDWTQDPCDIDTIKPDVIFERTKIPERLLVGEHMFVDKLFKDMNVFTEVVVCLEKEIRQDIAARYLAMLTNVVTSLEEGRAKLHKPEIESTLSVRPEKLSKYDTVGREEFDVLKEENRKLTHEFETFKDTALNQELRVRDDLANYYSSLIKTLEDGWKARTKEIEAESEDLLRWSVSQVENFYKERIHNIVGNRKRKRMHDDDSVDGERSIFEELEEENARNTSKIVVLKETVKKLKADNETISAEKNRYSFELGLIKDELKSFQDLAKYEFDRDCSENSDSVEATCLVQKLKNLFEDKRARVEHIEKELTEAKDKCTSVVWPPKEIEQTLSEKADELDEQLSEKKRHLDALTAQIEVQERRLMDVQRHVKNNSHQEVGTSTTANVMNESDESLQCPAIPRIANYFEDTLFEHDQSASFEKKNAANDSYGFSSSDLLLGDEVPDPPSIVTQAHVDFKTDRNVLSMKDHVSQKVSIKTTDVDRNDSCDSMKHDPYRSSECSSKDDSGIAELSNRIRGSTSVSDSIKIYETDDKETQTGATDKCTVDHETMQSKFEYMSLTDECVRETPVADMSKELENAKEELRWSRRRIADCERRLKYRSEIIVQLMDERNNMMLAHKEISRTAETKLKEHETKFGELTSKLKFIDLNESQVSKYFEYYLKKSINLEGRLRAVKSQLKQKSFELNDLNHRALENENDIEQMREDKNVNDVESVSDQYQREEHIPLHSGAENHWNENDIKRMTVQEEDNKLNLMVSKTCNLDAIETESYYAINVADYDQINIRTVKKIDIQDHLRFEELRERIEKLAKQDAMELNLRLQIIENNTAFLNLIRTSNENELERVKLQLSAKDREMCLFKENRDITIRQYQSLVKQLEDEIERSRHRIPKMDRLLRIDCEDPVKIQSADQDSSHEISESEELAYIYEKGSGNNESISSTVTSSTPKASSSDFRGLHSSVDGKGPQKNKTESNTRLMNSMYRLGNDHLSKSDSDLTTPGVLCQEPLTDWIQVMYNNPRTTICSESESDFIDVENETG